MGEDDGLDDLRRSFLTPTPVKTDLPQFQQTDADTWSKCIRPNEALSRYPYPLPIAMKQLERELQAGIVEAVCRQMNWRNGDERGVDQFILLPTWVWSFFPAIDSDFWETGYLSSISPGRSFSSNQSMQYFDVGFWPGGLPEAKISEPSAVEEPEKPQSRRTGRPAKPYWEDAIIAMFDGLWMGTLTPADQASLERAMLDWIYNKHGDSPSEASVRIRCAKIWKVHKKEG